MADAVPRRRHAPRVGRAAIAELAPALVVVGACMRPAAEDLLASGTVSGRPVLAGGAGFRSGDPDDVPELVVHEGTFAAVPEAARRLVDRVGATGG